MQWLTPSIVATLVGTLLLTIVYLYLYRSYRDGYLLIWVFAWGLYSLRFVFELIGISYPSIWVTITLHSITLISGYLLIWGTYRFAERSFTNVWVLVSAASVAWIVVASVLNAPFIVIMAPSFTLLAIIYIWTGVVIIQSEIGGTTSRIVTGICFILWGVHKADFPFLRTVEWFAPWGFLIAAALELAVALGILLIFFETLHSNLIASELKHRAIFDAARNVSFIITDAKDPEPTVLEFSPGAEQIFGYSRNEMLGKPVSILHRPKDVAKFPEFHRQMREGKIGFAGETELVRKSGEIFPAMFSTHPLLDEKRHMYAALSVSIDITRRKQDEENLKKLLREKNILLTEVHHRVKNNMQIIVSLLGLHAQSIKDEQLMFVFEESRNRINSMALVHEQLYRSGEFAQIKFGDYIDRLATTLLNMYQVGLDEIQLDIKAKDVFLDLEKAIPCGLIINELITNSLKHAFPNGKRGKLWIRLNPENDKMILEIGDNGVGVPDGIDFENPQSLGLQLVKLLAEHDLQGNIDLSRERGTLFSIEFPVKNINEGLTV